MTQVVKHKSRIISYVIDWPTTNENATSFVADSDGELFSDAKTNISSYTINGAAVSFPYSVVKGQSYAIEIIKTVSENIAELTLKQRRAVDKTISKSIAETIPEAQQGTKQYYIHSVDGKVSIVDSSLINDTNYLGGTSWTTNPIIAEIDLPNSTGSELWEACFFDYETDRIIIVGRDTVNVSRFILCALHVSGVKEDQIWNLDGDTQNAYDIIVSDTQGSTLYPALDFNTGFVLVQSGNRKYNSNLSNLKSWSYDTTGKSLLLSEFLLRKPSFNADYNAFTTQTCYQVPQTYERIFNTFIPTGDSRGAGCDSVNNYVYFTDVGGVNKIYVFNGNTQIATVSGSTYRTELIIPASLKRRMLFAKQGSFSDYEQRVGLFNLDTVATIKFENILNDTDVTGAKDAEYINSLECFGVLSNGTASSQGRRLVYYVDANNNGVDTLLKYKVLLTYDASFMATNRIRF